jgi:hypothetical protein
MIAGVEPQRHRGHRGSQRGSEDHSADTVFENRDVEIDEQAETPASEFHVGQ